MKKKIIKLTKIWFWAFIALLLILIGFIFINKEGDAIPSILGLPFFIFLVGMLILVAVIVIMDAVDSWKRDRKTYILGFVGAVVATSAVLIALEYFMNSHTVQIGEAIIEALIIICGIRAGEYIRNSK